MLLINLLRTDYSVHGKKTRVAHAVMASRKSKRATRYFVPFEIGSTWRGANLFDQISMTQWISFEVAFLNSAAENLGNIFFKLNS